MDANNDLRKSDLVKIVEAYCRQRYPTSFKRDVELKGSTKKWKFDFFIEDDEMGRFCIKVKDWNRTLGVNQVRQFQRACTDLGDLVDGGVLITNSFSPSAVSFGERFGISCYSRWDLLSKI